MERILIEEDRDKIELLRARAKHHVEKLNRAYSVAPFKNFDQLKRLVEGHPQYVRDEMRKDKLSRELMDRGIKIDVPYNLIERGRVLNDALESFEFTKFTDNGYEVDAEALHHAEEKHRRYVENPFQRKVWDVQETLLNAFNSFDFLGENARLRNFKDNEFISFNRRTGKWERNKWILIHANEGDFKY